MFRLFVPILFVSGHPKRNLIFFPGSKPKMESNKKKSVTWRLVLMANPSPWSKVPVPTLPQTVQSSAPVTFPTRTVTDQSVPICPLHTQSQPKSRNLSDFWLPSPAHPNHNTTEQRPLLVPPLTYTIHGSISPSFLRYIYIWYIVFFFFVSFPLLLLLPLNHFSHLVMIYHYMCTINMHIFYIITKSFVFVY